MIKHRRKARKTDYKKRFGMLKSEKPRLVMRKTNKYIIAQYVTSDETKDMVEIGVTSKHLMKYGWPEKFRNSLKSIPAAYLTGLLIGKKITKEKKETPIIDLGMLRSLHKTKVFAFIRGIIDSGLEIKHDEKIFPEENRIKGKDLKEEFSDFDEIKSKIERE